MRRVKLDRGIRGVAWVMGGPPNTHMPSMLIAVTGDTVILRHSDGSWRTGTYMNNEEAGKAATAMTEKQEHEGLKLVNGPAEFSADNDVADAVHIAILRSLNLL